MMKLSVCCLPDLCCCYSPEPQLPSERVYELCHPVQKDYWMLSSNHWHDYLDKLAKILGKNEGHGIEEKYVLRRIEDYVLKRIEEYVRRRSNKYIGEEKSIGWKIISAKYFSFHSFYSSIFFYLFLSLSLCLSSLYLSLSFSLPLFHSLSLSSSLSLFISLSLTLLSFALYTSSSSNLQEGSWQ